MRFTSKTLQYFFATAVLFLVVISMYLYLFFDIQNKNEEVRSVFTELSNKVAQEDRLRSVKAVVANTAPERALLAGKFVTSDGIVPFIETVESLGEIAGTELEITSVNVEPLVGTSPAASRDIFESLRLSVNAEGNWQSIFHLLALIERFPMQVSLERVQIEQVRDSNRWRTAFNIIITKLK